MVFVCVCLLHLISIGQSLGSSMLLLILYLTASRVALVVENMPANAGDIRDVDSIPLGWEDCLEKEMATHSSNPVWEIPWTEELAGYSS